MLPTQTPNATCSFNLGHGLTSKPPPAGRPHGFWEAGRQQYHCVRALDVFRLFALAEVEPEQAPSHAQKRLSSPHSAPQVMGKGRSAQGLEQAGSLAADTDLITDYCISRSQENKTKQTFSRFIMERDREMRSNRKRACFPLEVLSILPATCQHKPTHMLTAGR